LSHYFGTDGVRGRVGTAPMTVDFALRLASSAARVLSPGGGRVLIGKDTRVSGYMFESALEAGFVAAGVDVMLIGPLPTPGIAYMTQRLGCSFGVVISASHNPYEDNGIKFFDATGSKLSDKVEQEIEALLDLPVVTQESQHLGRAIRIDRSRTQYQDFCASTIPAGMTLKGFKIVIDCANGAGYKVAPRVLADLGAEIVPIGCSPNGRNINDGCGSTSPELLQLTVPGVRAQVGLALDGDGDRVVMVDELGRCVDGDQLLYILATARRLAGELKGPVVGTVMSNLGLEHALGERGIEFLRAQVGDRNVLAMLNQASGTLGGETSGHILCLDKTTTGDGLISALQVLAIMKQTGSGLAELAAAMKKYPQVLLNVQVLKRFDPRAEPQVVRVVEEVERRLKGRGRIVLRASGTEPVIRVMVEGADAALVKKGAKDIAAAVEAAPSASSGDPPGTGGLPRQAPWGLQLRGFAANLRRLSRRAKCPKVGYASSDGRGQLENARVAGPESGVDRRAGTAYPAGLADRYCGFSALCLFSRGGTHVGRWTHHGGRAGCVRRVRRRLYRPGECDHAQGCRLQLRDRRTLRAAALVSRR
jgi:phosphoglucosamine mutase